MFSSGAGDTGRPESSVSALHPGSDPLTGVNTHTHTHTLGLSRYHKMSYDTIPAEVSRYQVVSRYHPCSVVSLKLNSTK